MPKNLLLAIVCLASLSSVALAEEFQAKVVGVADGDTITVLQGSTPVKIRLQAVDCPEKAQAFGTKAKQFTSEMVFGKVVTVKVATKDKYGRTVAWVYYRPVMHVAGPADHPGHLREGPERCLNEELLRAGLAWHYTQYDKSEKLAKLEQEARAAKRGLWADPNPMPPWEWRHSGKKAGNTGEPPLPKLNCFQACMRDSAAQAVGIEAIKATCPRRCSTGYAAVPVVGHPDSAAAVPVRAGEFHGNVRSKVFHAPGCKDYGCRHCTAVFGSPEEALKAGYRPHGACVSGTGRQPPAGPSSKERACRADRDCVLLPLNSMCSCPPCGRVVRQSVNRTTYNAMMVAWARRRCRAPVCPACVPLVVGEKAVCIKGQCEVR
jgi:endonuclease YncB( thermonuclease family)